MDGTLISLWSGVFYKKQYELVFDVDGINNLTKGGLDRLLSLPGFDVWCS